MRKPPNPIPYEQRCTRCRHRQREPGTSSCSYCRDKRQAKMREIRAAVRDAVAQEIASASHDLPSPDLASALAAKGNPIAQAEVAQRTQNENVRTQNGYRCEPIVRATEDAGGYVAEMRHDAQPRNSGDSGNGLRLVVADLHAPNQDERAFKALLAMMADNRFAELILLGDAVELASLAWWGGPTTLQAYKDEAIEARHVLNRLLAQHGGPATLVVGNHDQRPDQKVERTAPQLHGSIKDEIGWDALGVRLVQEDQQPLIRGRLRFIHGHQDCGRNPPLRYAFKLAQLYGEPGTSVIAGHCHRDQSDSKPQHGGPVMAYLLGTLESRPKWLKTADSWTCSVAVADPESGCVQVLPIRDGTLWFGGKCYRGC